MFTIRTISNDGVINNYLGNCYSIIERFVHDESFREHFLKFYERNHVADLDDSSDEQTKNIIGFVTGDNIIIPIDQRQDYYIVGETGKTFEKINKKR